jgi:carbamoyltransferase
MSQPTNLRWLPDCLRQAGYTAGALQDHLGVASPDDVGPLNRAAALLRASDDRGPAAVLIRLLFLESAEPASNVAARLSRARCGDLVRLGLLQARGGRLTALLRIDALGDQYFLADRRFEAMAPQALHLPAASDPVYPPSSDSLLLRDAVTAPRATRVLDLCSGTGVQALQRADRADHIVAVDINPRAVALARQNAGLNGIDHAEVRCGDLYAPVRRERFDLILANPPFVASPYRSAASYHAGGATGDRVLRRVIAGWGRHLQPGGRAFAISHVALRRGESLSAVARSWFRGFPGRALVIVVDSGGPVDLAAAQSLFALDRGLSAYAAEVQRWASYLQRRRIERVAAVLVAAQRRGRHRVEVVDAPSRVLPIPLGPAPAQRIAAWLDH